ncbi:MAG: 23S rRNA (uracil(1939)-C(5))-methyltransferase RlmD [Lachnospiraceae bacterium]|nr:23S rRNA (uracil(1939)-C(5))-methyltransferase RlmD [Lachnospiraceae bacterium]
MKKNDVVEVKIEDIGTSGEGIGRYEGMTLFIKDALVGDTVKAGIMKLKKTYGYARLIEIIEPSPDRVTPKCELSRKCGGCQIQALSYERQLTFKEHKIKNNLMRIGGFTEEQIDAVMQPVIGMENPYHYRNKAQFPIGTDKDGNPVAGFYAGRTHSIIPVTNCYLGVDVNEQILQIVLAFLRKYQIPAYDEQTGNGIVRHVLTRYGFTTKELMVCIVINADTLPHAEELVAELTKLEGMTSISVNVNKKQTNVILGDTVKTLWGKSYITDYIGDVKYQISPLSFYQVNPVQTKKLYQTALEYAGLTGEETVWDLYCGIGTISLFLAKQAKKVYGVEIVPQAIADAKNNAKINGITNAEFFVGKAEEVYPDVVRQMQERGQQAYADVIVVDPPRKGCEESLLAAMVQMQPERIVYVSCDSATRARDLKYLCAQGYKLEKVQGVDQFCHTVHVETVVGLHRKDI